MYYHKVKIRCFNKLNHIFSVKFHTDIKVESQIVLYVGNLSFATLSQIWYPVNLLKIKQSGDADYNKQLFEYTNRSTNKFVRYFSRNLGLYCEKSVTM